MDTDGSKSGFNSSPPTHQWTLFTEQSLNYLSVHVRWKSKIWGQKENEKFFYHFASWTWNHWNIFLLISGPPSYQNIVHHLFSLIMRLLKHFSSPPFTHHMDVPYWLASCSSVCLITASPLTHWLMRELYKSYQNPSKVIKHEDGNCKVYQNIGKPSKFNVD
jgi:hypothetical protein